MPRVNCEVSLFFCPLLIRIQLRHNVAVAGLGLICRDDVGARRLVVCVVASWADLILFAGQSFIDGRRRRSLKSVKGGHTHTQRHRERRWQ